MNKNQTTEKETELNVVDPKVTTEKRVGRFALWYSYNKYKIPTYFILIAVVIFTAFLDFKAGNFEFNTHLSTIGRLTADSNIIGFYLFLIYLLAIVQVVNAISFSKKRSPFSLILLTIVAIVQVLLVAAYIMIIVGEMNSRSNLTFLPWIRGLGISSFAFSAITMVLGTILTVAATVFAWIFVDWKYVKVEE